MTGKTGAGPTGGFRLGNLIFAYGQTVANFTGVTGVFPIPYVDDVPIVTIGVTGPTGLTGRVWISSLSKGGVQFGATGGSSIVFYQAIGT
jgi:hypothetical protein